MDTCKTVDQPFGEDDQQVRDTELDWLTNSSKTMHCCDQCGKRFRKFRKFKTPSAHPYWRKAFHL
ncbi:hypothetical protein XENOCAPTIV_016220 [Xenoophorus captivus]|uniref:Uncharacterized protein n=1 Tax=Xenoophorus captivus TaxID=1517983 RepID=A0ABV0QS74_9TELE